MDNGHTMSIFQLYISFVIKCELLFPTVGRHECVLSSGMIQHCCVFPLSFYNKFLSIYLRISMRRERCSYIGCVVPIVLLLRFLEDLPAVVLESPGLVHSNKPCLEWWNSPLSNPSTRISVHPHGSQPIHTDFWTCLISVHSSSSDVNFDIPLMYFDNALMYFDNPWLPSDVYFGNPLIIFWCVLWQSFDYLLMCTLTIPRFTSIIYTYPNLSLLLMGTLAILQFLMWREFHFWCLYINYSPLTVHYYSVTFDVDRAYPTLYLVHLIPNTHEHHELTIIIY